MSMDELEVLRRKVERERCARLEAERLLQEKSRQLDERLREESRHYDELSEAYQRVELMHHQLFESEKLVSAGQLAAGVAHEINNPLAFVRSNLRTLSAYTASLVSAIEAARVLLGEQGDSDRRQAARVAWEAALARPEWAYLQDDLTDLVRESTEGLDRVARIVQDLRDHTRTDRPDAWDWTDLEAELERALRLSEALRARQIQVQREFAGLAPMWCQPSRMGQVFVQLVRNALQALRDGGTLVLRSGRDEPGEQVWLEVVDDGCGIAPEVLDRVFDPFFTTRSVGQGQGLGLWVAWGVVADHGGRIDVHSEPGQGARFRVTLPVRAAADVASATVQPPVDST